MKPLLIKIDDVVLNLAHASIITKERPLGTRPGTWFGVKAGASKHLIPEELFARVRPSLLESGWVPLEANQQEHLLNLALVSEVTAEVLAAYGGKSKKYVFFEGRGKDRVEILSTISPSDPMESLYFSAVSVPPVPIAVTEQRKYTIAGVDRFGRRCEFQVDASGQRCS
jgi:hypothetical protein